MILVSCNMKGGTGKSTTAQNAAVYFSKLKNKKVLLVDADPQQTTTDWIQERRQNIENDNLYSVQLNGNIRLELLEFEKSYDVVVIDCGGYDSETMRSALSVASHAILPFRPKRRDLKKLNEMSEIMKLAKALNPNIIFRALLTQCPHLPSQIKRIMDAKEACNSFDIYTLNNILYNRNIYDDSEENGSSVIEQDTDKKAKAEFIEMIEEFLGEK